MSACEVCWTEASRRALLLGGATVDHYRALIASDPYGHSAAIDASSAPVQGPGAGPGKPEEQQR